jgi:4-amino-4-deoxy-L-arabinose transferase-like glycosyltransferase
VASPLIWYANATATDGPYFPPPLVALGFIALPYAGLLFPLQLIVVVYEFIRKKPLGIPLFIVGAIGGLVTGFIWYSVMKSNQIETSMILLLFGVAIMQALVVFGCHWIAGKLKIGDFSVNGKVSQQSPQPSSDH